MLRTFLQLLSTESAGTCAKDSILAKFGKVFASEFLICLSFRMESNQHVAVFELIFFNRKNVVPMQIVLDFL